MQFIVVRTQFEGFHFWIQAPEEVAFLREPHRHIFHVEVKVEVFHDDRELEIILFKRALDKFLSGDLEYKSCEMMCKEIQQWVKSMYPAPASKVPFQHNRTVDVQVLEDGENGAYLQDTDVYPEEYQAEELTDTIAGPINSDTSKPPAGLAKFIKDVEDLDRQFALDLDPELTTDNLMFYTTALLGEAGELANVVKKIVRDGESPELWKSLDFEAVDIMIYFVKFLKLTQMDFDKVWDEKHEELRGRYVAGKKHLSYASRKLERGI